MGMTPIFSRAMTPPRPSRGTSLARARAASHLTASRRGFIVVYHTEGGTTDAEHEGLPRAPTPARGEDHRQDLAPRARRRQGDGRLVVDEGGRPRRRPRAPARADLLADLGHDGVPPGRREA